MKRFPDPNSSLIERKTSLGQHHRVTCLLAVSIKVLNTDWKRTDAPKMKGTLQLGQETNTAFTNKT